MITPEFSKSRLHRTWEPTPQTVTQHNRDTLDELLVLDVPLQRPLEEPAELFDELVVFEE